eukprot:gnl/TRDRNA2_/TRDRNA2_146537_c0_seq1.p1 gnl/TRDRNA2_/TRDRNA2_146537_c0~~gnl/TRDRNA2_/TRDRNA2_146537_c0_seq1.p1  ORF type:complete len:290 (-),score=51.40 gnl/TRDRNA2_/TRDRNA2_146537_c0_seq1:50-919(-)
MAGNRAVEVLNVAEILNGFRALGNEPAASECLGPEGLSLAEEFLLLEDASSASARTGDAMSHRSLVLAALGLAGLMTCGRVRLQESSGSSAVLVAIVDASPVGVPSADALLSDAVASRRPCSLRRWLDGWVGSAKLPELVLEQLFAKGAKKRPKLFSGSQSAPSPALEELRLRYASAIQSAVAPNLRSALLLGLARNYDRTLGRDLLLRSFLGAACWHLLGEEQVKHNIDTLVDAMAEEPEASSYYWLSPEIHDWFRDTSWFDIPMTSLSEAFNLHLDALVQIGEPRLG